VSGVARARNRSRIRARPNSKIHPSARNDARGYERLEARHHEKELQRAAEYLRKALPGIDVQGYFVDFDGIWEVDLPAQLASAASPTQFA
jgi:hypothetical protein